MFTITKFLLISLVCVSILSIRLPLNNVIVRNNVQFLSANYTNNYTNETLIDNDTIRIVNIYQDLYELKKNQSIQLYVSTPIFPAKLTDISLFSKNNKRIYHPQIECFYENYYAHGKVMSLLCILDLTDISKGEYLIKSFYYDNKNIDDGESVLYIQEEKKENITEKIILENGFGIPYAYSPEQNFTFYFRDIEAVNISLIHNITFKSLNNSIFTVPMECLYKFNRSIFCLGDFSYVPANYYDLIYLSYDYVYIHPKYDIRFNVIENPKPKPVEKDLILLNVSREAFLDNTYLNFTFNKWADPSNIYYYLIDCEKTYRSIHINHYNCITFNTSMVCEFNLTDAVSTGFYYINYYYRENNITKNYTTNMTIYFKEKKAVYDDELIEVYHNFKSYRDNQIAFFTLSGRTKNNYLAYIVLKDDVYSRINVLQTFDCQNTGYNDNDFLYDIKCKLNLTHVSKGEYYVSEYYINNQHYYSKNRINVVVQ